MVAECGADATLLVLFHRCSRDHGRLTALMQGREGRGLQQSLSLILSVGIEAVVASASGRRFGWARVAAAGTGILAIHWPGVGRMLRLIELPAYAAAVAAIEAGGTRRGVTRLRAAPVPPDGSPCPAELTHRKATPVDICIDTHP